MEEKKYKKKKLGSYPFVSVVFSLRCRLLSKDFQREGEVVVVSAIGWLDMTAAITPKRAARIIRICGSMIPVS